MEYEPLSADARKVFEWIAGHGESKVCFWFAEVRRDCDINSDHELHVILTALQEYPKRVASHLAIIKAIYPEEQHREGAFEASVHASRAWAEYCSWEQKHLCPECGQPQLREVTVLRCQNPACRHEHESSAAPDQRPRSVG